jgi:hypothetical protein
MQLQFIFTISAIVQAPSSAHFVHDMSHIICTRTVSCIATLNSHMHLSVVRTWRCKHESEHTSSTCSRSSAPPLVEVTSKQALGLSLRPTRPLSWWSCRSPKRSACSTTMRVAAGTSIPTSITIVDTSSLQWPARKASSAAAFDSAAICPVITTVWSAIKPPCCLSSLLACTSLNH